MKSVLIIDAQPMLQEYLKDKLAEEKIRVELADSQRDALPKLFSVLPDLVILNVKGALSELNSFFREKSTDINGRRIPIIVIGPIVEKEDVAELVQYGVIKYFTRPVKYDLFFESVGRVLHIPFAIDTTPCVLDVHLNDEIIFVEIALALNREKLSIMKYKISEIIDANKISEPKIVLMLTSLSLSFVDGYNLELLFDNITSDKRIKKENIKVLSLDAITKDFISGHQSYAGIQVVTSLSSVLGSLVNDGSSDNVQDVILDKIISSTGDEETSGDMRFSSDTDATEVGELESTDFVVKKIAVVDDDPTVRQFIRTGFKTVGVTTIEFASGTDFVSKIAGQDFDAIILDIYMPGISGFDVLKFLKSNNVQTPVIVYSQMTQKEYIVQALNLGAKSYLLKPQPQQALVQKVLEVVNARK